MNIWKKTLAAMKTIELNFFQTIAFTGLIVSFLAQGGLKVIEKQVNNFEYLYIIWVVVFMIGSGIKFYYRNSDEAHHHHH
jgi:hypothetical protein